MLSPKVPVPSVVQIPLLFVLAAIDTGALLHAVYGPVVAAVAGSFTVNVAAFDTDAQGPGPSGSLVVQVRMMLPGVALAGVKVVLALVVLANVPAPGVVLHTPVPLPVEVMFTAPLPQVVYGPPALAVAAGVTVMVLLAVAGVQGPGPSGSMVVQVMVTGLLVSPLPGVYVVLASVLLAKVPAPFVVQFPLLLVVAVMLTGVLLQAV